MNKNKRLDKNMRTSMNKKQTNIYNFENKKRLTNSNRKEKNIYYLY